MEAFLKSVWEKKSWIVTTAFLLFTLNAAPETFIKIKQLYEKQLEFSLEMKDTGPESQRQLRLIDLYRESMLNIDPMLTFYKSNFEGKNSIPSEQIKLGIELAKTISNIQRTKLAEASEIRLSCQACRDLQSKLVSGIGYNLELTTAFLEAFKNEKNSQDKLNTAYAVNMHKNLSIASTVIPAFTQETRKTTIEFEKNIADLKLMSIYSYQLFAYFIYMFIFAACAFVAYIKFRLTSRTAKKDQMLPQKSPH
ncbi:hypothetical protein D3C87_917990 [compost metagenome]|jgi:hypothetical protein